MSGRPAAFAPGFNAPSGMAIPGAISGTLPPAVHPFATTLMIFSVLLLTNHLGRPFEHILVGLRIPAFICGLGIIAGLALGLPAFRTKVGVAFAVFIGWMFLITPLSTWKGGSVTYLLPFLQFWVILFMILACAPNTMRQLMFLVNITAISSVINILIAGRFDEQARFNMEGTYGNSDDAAILAGFAIPFWLLLSSRYKFALRAPLALCGTLFLFRIIILTGTRSILIALVCLFLAWFLRSKIEYRVVGLMVVVIGGFAVLATAPQSVIARLSTTFEAFSASPDQVLDEASQSAAERRELLKDGILTTLTHPIWGVGPGQFGQYRWSTLGTVNKPKTWFKTHNTYLEVSADNGIPGLLIYLFFMWSIYRTILRVRRATTGQSSPNLALAFQFASYMELAWVFLVTSALFMTMEAHPYMFVLAGFAVAAERLVKTELAKRSDVRSPLPKAPQWAPNLIGAR